MGGIGQLELELQQSRRSTLMLPIGQGDDSRGLDSARPRSLRTLMTNEAALAYSRVWFLDLRQR